MAFVLLGLIVLVALVLAVARAGAGGDDNDDDDGPPGGLRRVRVRATAPARGGRGQTNGRRPR